LDRDGLAGVEPDSLREGDFRLIERLFDEPLLEVNGGADRLTRRRENAERLVAAELQQGAATSLDPVARDLGELRRELRRGLVAALLREEGVPADVGDQERPDLGALRSIVPARVVGLVWAGHARLSAVPSHDA
jgi:hypothetical protein